MGYKRLIRYQYYQILINKVNAGKNSQDTGKIFNFAEWAEQVKKENLITKPVDFNNAKARIEHVAYSKNYNVWCLQLMKLRRFRLRSIFCPDISDLWQKILKKPKQ